MGIDPDRLLSKEVDEGLVCSICTDILDDPIMIDDCEHAFCRQCIHHWYRMNKTCPQDRKRFTENKLVKIPRYMQNHLNALMLKCFFYKNGCTYTSRLEAMDAHKMNCLFDPINCRIDIRIDNLLTEALFARRVQHRYRYEYNIIITSMVNESKKNALRVAKEALFQCGRTNFGLIATYIKRNIEPKDVKFWQCIVGTDFDCFVTASFSYISLKIDGISIIAFKTL